MKIYELRKLIESRVKNSYLPLLPFRGSVNSGLFTKEPFRPCKMDVCSKKMGNCAKCPDLEKCTELYDELC